MSGPPKDFALLIGKKLSAKDKGKGGGRPPGPYMGGDEKDLADDGEDQEKSMKLSAMKDFIAAVHAKSPEMACAALDDYNEMQGDGEEPDGDEGGPPAEPEE